MSHRRPVCHIVRDVHERPVCHISSTTCRSAKMDSLDCLSRCQSHARRMCCRMGLSGGRTHYTTDQWAEICSAHVISYGLLENSPCGFMSPRRIYDASHRHHSWPPFMRDRTSAVPWRVCCSFRERKLEFLSTQTVETPRFCSFAGKLPLFCLRKTTKTKKGLRALPSGSLPWQHDQRTLQSSRPDHRGARRPGRATAAG